jgi:hypothetical protein
VKFVANGQRFVEANLPSFHLLKQFNHDRDFHGAGRVKAAIRVVTPLSFAVERNEKDPDVGMGCRDLRLDLLRGVTQLRFLREGAQRQGREQGQSQESERQAHYSSAFSE